MGQMKLGKLELEHAVPVPILIAARARVDTAARAGFGGVGLRCHEHRRAAGQLMHDLLGGDGGTATGWCACVSAVEDDAPCARRVCRHLRRF